MKIVVIGNSIVNGFPLKRSQCFTSILRAEYGHETINKGVNGDTTGGILERFEKDALASKPEKILLMTGTNDFITGDSVENAVANIKGMVELAGKDKIVALTPLLTHPALAGRMWMRADYDEVNRKLKEFAGLLCGLDGIKVIDTQNAFAEYVEKTGAESSYIDGIHPSGEAHEFLAEYIVHSLQMMKIAKDK